MAASRPTAPLPPGQHPAEFDLDAVTGRVTAALLSRSHVLAPAEVAEALARLARPLGVSAARVYLADLQQRQLALLSAGEAEGADTLPIDSTLGGRAFQTLTFQQAPVRGTESGDSAGDSYQVWIPLVDGTERLGVLGLTVADASEARLDSYRALASLAGLMIASKAAYSDSYAQIQRSREMALQAELAWAFLAPRTFATDRVLLAASLEPAYEVGGDAYDYSLLGDHLHVSIFDALGHDLSAGLLASVGMASCRSTRRAGGSLADVAARADDAIAGFFGEDRFVTALLCDLHLVTGLFTWILCGHPAAAADSRQPDRPGTGPHRPAAARPDWASRPQKQRTGRHRFLSPGLRGKAGTGGPAAALHRRRDGRPGARRHPVRPAAPG
jgi:hypothetical protein